MRHSNLKHMLEELLDDSDEILISSNSKRAVLYGQTDGSMFLLEGDFSGTPEENEAEVRRIMNSN